MQRNQNLRPAIAIECPATAIGRSAIIIEHHAMTNGRLVMIVYSKVMVKNQKHKGEKCTLTPRQRRPGFRPEGTQRSRLKLVIMKDASRANPPGALRTRWVAQLEASKYKIRIQSSIQARE